MSAERGHPEEIPADWLRRVIGAMPFPAVLEAYVQLRIETTLTEVLRELAVQRQAAMQRARHELATSPDDAP